jgi:hypothetical protein
MSPDYEARGAGLTVATARVRGARQSDRNVIQHVEDLKLDWPFTPRNVEVLE